MKFSNRTFRNLCGIILILLFITSCKKSEDPAPAQNLTLLTFKQDSSTPTAETDNWIFVSDESGNILGTKSFEAGEIIIFESDKLNASQKINVTILIYRNNSSGESFNFVSYLAIPLNQSWLYGKIDINPLNVAGTSNLKVNNYSGTFDFTNFLISGDRNVSNNSSIQIGNSITLPITFYKSPTKIAAAGYRNNQPVYLEMDASTGNDYTVDLNSDFKPLDNTISIDYTAATYFSGTIWGIHGNPSPLVNLGYANSFYRNFGGTGTVILGYNNGFDIYNTVIKTQYSKISKNYYKFGGAPPSTIPFLNYTLSVNNNDYRSFSFALSGNYHLRHSYWFMSGSPVAWEIFSPPEGKQRFSEIPQEIRSKYTSLNLSLLKYQVSDFTLYLDGFSYDDLIKTKMNINSASRPYPSEYQLISFDN